MSRSPPALPIPDDSDVQVATIAAGDSDTEVLDESRELLELQLAKPYYAAMIRFLQSEMLPADEQVGKGVLSEKNNFMVIEKILYRMSPTEVDRLQLCVPGCKREALLTQTHSGTFLGHFSPKSSPLNSG